MSISFTEYYNEMTLKNVVNAFRAYTKHKTEESVDKWRMVRHLSMLYYNSKVKKGEQISNPAKYMPLPGDITPKPNVLSTEQILKLIK